jgi:hypothetical protein
MLAACGNVGSSEVESVILLDPAVLRHPAILRSNPNRDPAKPSVYVGMTGLAVEDRFENKNGVKSAWVVEKYGVRLMPELYEYLNPMPFEAAAQMEKDLAEDLRAEGYTVAGGTYLGSVSNSCRRIGGSDTAMAPDGGSSSGYVSIKRLILSSWSRALTLRMT